MVSRASTIAPPTPADTRGDIPGAWLTAAERNPPALPVDSNLLAAIDIFGADVDLGLIPVLDAQGRPIGAIYEKQVRRLLLNQFGHALLRNPAYGKTLADHVQPCPVAEATLDIGRLFDTYRAADGREGMILTLGGKLHALVGNHRLVHLAADREVRVAHARGARAQRIEKVSERFETQAAVLAGAMGELSALIEQHAGATAERAIVLGERATGVATAATQTSQNISEIAARGHGLFQALGQIGVDTSDTKSAAAEAAALVGAGSARTRELLRSAQSIDSVIMLISDIARQVNLLALNATIEAARAGEAGRGFTIVANEVKQLATQAGTAAQRITADVHEIRRGIGDVASAHDQVERAIGTMAALAAGVEASVGAQGLATATIARNVDEVFDASTAIRHDVEAMRGATVAASASALEMGDLARRLQAGANALSGQAAAFLAEIREG